MNKNILLMEDDDFLARLYRNYLSAHGHNVDIACNGEVGVRKFLANTKHYDLIVSDNNMPQKCGFDALTEIRKVSDVPTIMVTADHEAIMTMPKYRMVVDRLLSKPIPLSELEAIVSSTEIQKADRYTDNNAIHNERHPEEASNF